MGASIAEFQLIRHREHDNTIGIARTAGALFAAIGSGTYALDFCFPKSSKWRAKTPLREGWIPKEGYDENETNRSRRLRFHSSEYWQRPGRPLQHRR